MGHVPPLVARVHRYILENLEGADLSPRAIALANGVSVRQLHRVFSATGTTVGHFVRKVRLARCAADLRVPGVLAEGITGVAFRWGFNDSAHFSKAFRAEFGVTPRAYRAQHVGARSSATVRLRPAAAGSAATTSAVP
jgi:AraC-like DNA-binding protein